MNRIWAAPSRKTAVGVIRFSLPFPISSDLATWGFARALRRSEGSATIVSKKRDVKLPGTRSVIDSGPYNFRANVVTRGWHGWVVYTCTLNGQPIDVDELRLAELSREKTELGLDGTANAARPATVPDDER